MRIYTCIFEKDRQIEIEDVCAPWDRKPAENVVTTKLELTRQDKIIALIPGSHTHKSWLFKEKPASKISPVKKTENKFNLRDYIPNGF